MRTVALGEVVAFTNGGTPSRSKAEYWDGSIPWITGADISEAGEISARSYISDAGVKGSSTTVVPKGTVLLLTRTSVGKVGVLAEPMAINQDITAITPLGELDTRYLVHFLRTSKSALLRNLRGATIKGVTRDDVAALRLVLPPLPEQRRIAAILDRANAIRAKRRQVLAHLDALTQSVFTSMFSNENYQLVSAGIVMPRMRNGLSPATAGAHVADVLTLSAVTRGAFDPTAVKSGFFAVDPPADKRVTNNDFLMCRGNGNKDLVGVGTYSPIDHPELVFPDTVIAGTIDPTLVDMQFLETAWKRPEVRVQIRAVARTTNGTFKVNQKTLAGVQLAVPPLDLQHAFAKRAEVVHTQEDAVRRSLAADDELFASLQSRAFRGEL